MELNVELKRSTWMAWEEAPLLIGRHMGVGGGFLEEWSQSSGVNEFLTSKRAFWLEQETGKDVKMVAMFGKNE